jgi:hypothetical protein
MGQAREMVLDGADVDRPRAGAQDEAIQMILRVERTRVPSSVSEVITQSARQSSRRLSCSGVGPAQGRLSKPPAEDGICSTHVTLQMPLSR